MRIILTFFVLALTCIQSGKVESTSELTARALREEQPKVCEQAKEECYTSSFERSCISAETNRFVCYRDYAFAKEKSSICDSIEGASGTGHSFRDTCYYQYAREKKDIATCEKLNTKDARNEILYPACVESVQDLRGNYSLEECMKIRGLDEDYPFSKCIAGVAKQSNDTSLCAKFLSESKVVDPWGKTLVERCLAQTKAK